jgi:hypothetical protein
MKEPEAWQVAVAGVIAAAALFAAGILSIWWSMH